MISDLMGRIADISHDIRVNSKLFGDRIPILILCVLSITIVVLVRASRHKDARLPQGPSGVPILGHLIAMGRARSDPNYKWVSKKRK